MRTAPVKAIALPAVNLDFPAFAHSWTSEVLHFSAFIVVVASHHPVLHLFHLAASVLASFPRLFGKRNTACLCAKSNRLL